MKKLIIAITAIAVIGIGGSAAHAQELDPDAAVPLPIECSEQDEGAPDDDGDGIPDECLDFYVDQGQSSPTTTVPADVTTTTAAPQSGGSLPRTGSGMSGPLQIGGILLVLGGLAVVATRRRSTATAA